MVAEPRVLLTGATGFLGAEVARKLLARGGLRVIAALRPTTDCWRLEGLRGKLETVSLDLTEEASIVAALREVRPSHVVHCAAQGVEFAKQDATSAFAVNVEGTMRLQAEAARAGAWRFVGIGSCSEYGNRVGPIEEDSPMEPSSVYGASKATATLLLRERGRTLGMETVVLRLFGLWGPRESEYRLVPQIIAACRKGESLDLTPGDQIRDYSFVGDAADWIIRIALHEEALPFGLFNLGTGRAATLEDFVLSIARLMGGASLMRFGVLGHRPGEPKSMVADIGRLRRTLGTLQTTSLEDGLKLMLAAQPRENRAAGPVS